MAIHYLPWVGARYNTDNDFRTRLLLLGESHYGDPEPDATIRYTREYADGEWSHRFWTTTMQVVTGRHHTEIDRQAFWESLSFYNYVQQPVGDGPRERPTEQMWLDAQVPFFEVLAFLKPKLILVLGSELWENLPPEGTAGPTIVVTEGETRDTWIYSYEGGRAIATWVYHPSSIKGASSVCSYPFVECLLRLDPCACLA